MGRPVLVSTVLQGRLGFSLGIPCGHLHSMSPLWYQETPLLFQRILVPSLAPSRLISSPPRGLTPSLLGRSEIDWGTLQNRQRLTGVQLKIPVLPLTYIVAITSRSCSSDARETLPSVDPVVEALGLAGFRGSLTLDTGTDAAKTSENLGLDGSDRALLASLV